MFEELVDSKIKSEQAAVEGIDFITKDKFLSCNLSDFTKNYLINDNSQIENFEDLKLKIEKSNKLYFNYAIRPKWTLLTFLFSNFESRPPSEITKKLNLFPFYNFYGDSIKNFISDNFQIFVTRSEVTEIIRRTNDKILEVLTTDINQAKIKNFFIQLFNFKYGPEPNWNLESKIPYSFIRIFLEDKSYPDQLAKFKVVKDLTDEMELSLVDITKIMTGKYELPEKPKPTPPAEEPAPKKVELDLTKPSPPVKKIEPKEEKKNIPQTKTEAPKTAEKKIYSEQLIKASEEKVPVKTPETGIVSGTKNLKSIMDEKLLERITEKVYNSDLLYMEKSFTKLSHFKTWFEASNHLKEIFKNNRVDIYNKDVITFVDTVSELYKSKR